MSYLRSLPNLNRVNRFREFRNCKIGFRLLTEDCKIGGGDQAGEGGDKSGGGGLEGGGGVKPGTGEMDFVQKLFIEKIREYDRKKKESGGKMFDPIPELETERQQLHEVLMKSYFKTEKPPSDLASFPAMNFKDAPLDPIDMETDGPKTTKSKK